MTKEGGKSLLVCERFWEFSFSKKILNYLKNFFIVNRHYLAMIFCHFRKKNGCLLKQIFMKKAHSMWKIEQEESQGNMRDTFL